MDVKPHRETGTEVVRSEGKGHRVREVGGPRAEGTFQMVCAVA